MKNSLLNLYKVSKKQKKTFKEKKQIFQAYFLETNELVLHLNQNPVDLLVNNKCCNQKAIRFCRECVSIKVCTRNISPVLSERGQKKTRLFGSGALLEG